MLVTVSLGGNALLTRGQSMTAENQRANVRRAVAAIVDIIDAGHQVVISHGNGPQIGLLALQSAALHPEWPEPLDLLGAETQGGIGYMIEQELENLLRGRYRVVTLLTQVEVDPNDPAFGNPTKPIGPVYSKAEADKIAASTSWVFKSDNDDYRRVVPSPKPQRIPDIIVVRILLDHDVIVICAGGGGIPVVRGPDGALNGIEAVIDKDWASAMLSEKLQAHFMLLLTDAEAVYENWGSPWQKPIRRTTSAKLRKHQFAEGSMGPKVAAACHFVDATGGSAGIGLLSEALAILNGASGTLITRD